MDVKLVLAVLTAVFTVCCLFFGTKNGFYDTDKYHGNGSAHYFEAAVSCLKNRCLSGGGFVSI